MIITITQTDKQTDKCKRQQSVSCTSMASIRSSGKKATNFQQSCIIYRLAFENECVAVVKSNDDDQVALNVIIKVGWHISSYIHNPPSHSGPSRRRFDSWTCAVILFEWAHFHLKIYCPCCCCFLCTRALHRLLLLLSMYFDFISSRRLCVCLFNAHVY